jgi:hypothetical protein
MASPPTEWRRADRSRCGEASTSYGVPIDLEAARQGIVHELAAPNLVLLTWSPAALGVPLFEDFGELIEQDWFDEVVVHADLHAFFAAGMPCGERDDGDLFGGHARDVADFAGGFESVFVRQTDVHDD